MYQGSFLCTIHFHRTLYYKGPSYVLYIKWTLIKNYILYTKGPSYVNSLEANQPGTDQATPTYIRWTLIKNYILYTKGPSYVLYIRWTLIKNYILYTKGPSYVNSLQANQPGTDQATPTYIRWTLIKNYILYTKGPSICSPAFTSDAFSTATERETPHKPSHRPSTIITQLPNTMSTCRQAPWQPGKMV